ncbi:signal recognition particle-docking protein FtsY [Massilia norwichensis]|uniref:Signal recognition particle receptor FtsY n=1 Tax=Massilia norwichensis TaxID=1442366 RepID=A0ABT2A438_9BURK|nr:signal recognition particle-docking protein FtsY [Massilia norwichensis]MCS0588947.1 signal recognition particle-docking protein FtsY [Massilia norwichensis]
MFSFFKKKKPEAETPVQAESAATASPAAETPAEAPAQPGFLRRLFGAGDDAFVPTPEAAEPAPQPEAPQEPEARDATNIDPAAEKIARDAAALSNGYEGQLFPETAERPGSEQEKKKSWMARLKAGLSKTSSNLSLLFVGARIDEDLYEELESALLMSDAGMDATQYLLDSLRRKVKEEKLLDAVAVKAALKELMVDLLRPLEKPLELGRHEPLVMMIAGVNGAGKTTTIGKLAKHMQRFDQSVLLAAGDTFRAAAREQLMVWGQRNNVTVISQASGDPAAVAFDAVQSGRARGVDVVMVDTAGRLPTQLHLMEELKKIKRVIGKGMEAAPHETLLVIDGNTGQNALAQVKAFDDALQLTGLVITKLDGTAKGGILAAIARTRPVPVYFIGVGEKLEDLQPFSADEFAEALLG